ncbi:MAG: hypothetical protein CXT77_03305 [uncultured DHVE6 group euryarchaeote]|jgi:hypothetical protein|nr:MAG: hypothetical protein CXT77_03305 [uncultured DHVE6 group euryarchaeote]
MALEIVAPIIMGVIAGIIDIGFMVKDLSGDAKSTIGHGVGAMTYLIAFSFVAFNIELATNSGFLPTFFQNQIAVLIILALITATVVHAKSAVFAKSRGPGTHETWLHSIILGVLVAASPFIWPLIEGYLPF